MQRPIILVLRTVVAGVWLVFGLYFKVLDQVPRHRAIVGAILGESVARPATIAIGLGECALGLWVLSGIRARACATTQTLAIITMNAIELSVARDLLLAPLPMLGANAVLLGAAWTTAIVGSNAGGMR